MKKILLYEPERVLLIFLLLVNLSKDKIVFITFFQKNGLKKLKGEKILIDFEKIECNIIKRSLYIRKKRIELKNLLKEIKNKKAELYGLDHQFLGKRLFFNEEIKVIEEGTINHLDYKKFKHKGFIQNLKKIIFKILKNFGISERVEELGYDKSIKKIYLTKNLYKKSPKELEKKIEVIDLKELWNQKTEEEQKYILDVFNFDYNILKKINKDTIMLFTQPLSEDGVISEERKIEIYSKIINKNLGSSIIIKPHPREITDYKKYFPNCYIMEEKYPVEILELVGIKIKKVITLFSSAVFGFGNDTQIQFYGTEVDEELYNRFGSCDNIMKRNAFL